MHVHQNALADGRWDTIRSDAQVSPHFCPRDLRQMQGLSVKRIHCEQKVTCVGSFWKSKNAKYTPIAPFSVLTNVGRKLEKVRAWRKYLR